MAKPTMACTYCGYHLKNTLYMPPRPPSPQPSAPIAHPPAAHPSMRRYLWMFYVLPFVLMALGAIPALISSSRVERATRQASRVAASASAAASSNKPIPVDPQRQLEQKLALYIDCLDDTYWRMLDSRRRYLSWIKDARSGPTCKERNLYGLYELGSTAAQSCAEHCATARDQTPSFPPLEQAAAAYAKAIAQIAPLLTEATSYYSKKSYTLDDCARGKELHPKLMASFDSTTRARDALRAILADKTRGTLQRCIDRTKGPTHSVGAHRWALLIKEAGDVVGALRVQARAPKPDMDAIKAAIARYVKASTALEAVGKAQQEAAGFDWTIKRYVDDFQTAAIAFLKSRAGRRFDHSRRTQIRWGWDRHGIDGTFEKVVAQYNGLVARMAYLKECSRLLLCEDEQCPEPR